MLRQGGLLNTAKSASVDYLSFVFYICEQGCSTWAENIPNEPDPGNAGVGKNKMIFQNRQSRKELAVFYFILSFPRTRESTKLD